MGTGTHTRTWGWWEYGRSLTFHCFCFLQIRRQIGTYSPSITHSETNKVGIVYNIVVGESGSLWTPCSPLKQINKQHDLIWTTVRSMLHHNVNPSVQTCGPVWQVQYWRLLMWTECWWVHLRTACSADPSALCGADSPLLASHRLHGASPVVCYQSQSPSVSLAPWHTQDRIFILHPQTHWL